jgi:hypothetical protein
MRASLARPLARNFSSPSRRPFGAAIDRDGVTLR